jgi:hypothetical protein
MLPPEKISIFKELSRRKKIKVFLSGAIKIKWKA